MKLKEEKIKSKILQNIYWLVVDKFLILFLQFFIGVKVANYYGKEIYGEYSYAVTIISFSPIILECINARVIKKFYDENFNKLVSSVSVFKNYLSIIIFLIILLSITVIRISSDFYYLLLLLSINNILLTMTSGIENYFEFKLLSKNTVIAGNIVKVISCVAQYIGMSLGFNIILLPIILITGSIIRVILLKYFYFKEFKVKLLRVLDFKIIKKIIKESYYIWFSFISYLLYTQLDKMMIKKLLGVSNVGIYSIAIQLSLVLSILIGPFQNSVYPKLMKLYKINYEEYKIYYLRLNTLFTQIYFVLCILSIFVVRKIFPYIFDKSYLPAIGCYSILTISIFFKANGALQTGHMTLKNITKKSCYKTGLGLILNIILNIYFIKKYGIVGAAMATSLTEAFSIFIIDFFIKEYREQFVIQLKSFNPLNMKG